MMQTQQPLHIDPSHICQSAAVKSFLKNNPSVNAIVTIHGRIYLAGVPHPKQSNQLIEITRKATGINDVKIMTIDAMDYEAHQSRNQRTGDKQVASTKSSNEHVTTVLNKAISINASDLYIDLFLTERKALISYKVFGYRRPMAEYDFDSGLKLIRAMWSRAQNANHETNAPCDCSFSFEYNSKTYRIRANSLPEIRGTSTVCRIRDPSFVLPLEDCGYSEKQWRMIRRLTKLPGGLILISGETNSGKSTTLASLMQAMPTTKKIIEIADPVEVVMPHVTHIELNHQAENAEELYTRIQAAIVRQNPDTLILGEIRDQITATAAQAMAIQGKLVYSTLHTQSCLAAIPRLESLGVDRHLLGLREFLGGVINQNLVPLICQQCALSRAPSPAQTHHYQNLFGENIKFINSAGCDMCYHGIAGQTLVAEVYPFALDKSGTAHKFIENREFVELEKYMTEHFQVQSKHNHAALKIQDGLIDPIETEHIIGEFIADNTAPDIQQSTAQPNPIDTENSLNKPTVDSATQNPDSPPAQQELSSCAIVPPLVSTV